MDADLDALRTSLLAGARLREVLANDLSFLRAIADAAREIARCFAAGNKLLLCGNGGSAADCQHMAAEFVSRLNRDFDRAALPAIALTTDTSFLTAFANDCGYAGVFQRQVEALGREGDVLLGISTSGASENVARALDEAHARGLRSIALVGAGGPIADRATVAIRVPAETTQLIQEVHLGVEHSICERVERLLFGAAPLGADNTNAEPAEGAA